MALSTVRRIILFAALFVCVGQAACDTRAGGVLGELIAGFSEGEVTLILLNTGLDDVRVTARFTRNGVEMRSTERYLPSKTPPAMQRVVPTAADVIDLDINFPDDATRTFQAQLTLGKDFVGGGLVTFVIDPKGPKVLNVPVFANQPPVADAGADFTIASSRIATLDGRRSFDPDAEPLTYQWEQITGPPAVLDDPSLPAPMFRAPAAGFGSTFTILFRLTVSDGNSRPVFDEVLVTVVGSPNPPPTAPPPPVPPLNIGIAHQPHLVAEGGQSLLNAMISGGAGTYSIRWSAASPNTGPIGSFLQPNAATTSWIAPRGFLGDYLLTCDVRDAVGNAASTSVIVNVKADCNVNLIPDEADINNGASQDTDGNGVPDECE